jgi:hypothetical protein
MTSRARLLATVLLLAPLAFACGKREERPPAATQPASPPSSVAATEAPAPASAPATTAATPLPAGTAESAVPATARPHAPAAAATAAPPPTAQAEKPAATPPPVPARPPVQRPKGKITLPGKLGAVTFDHESHAGKRGIACTTCHHPSRPQKPLASEHQACRHCHTMPAAPPMKTSLQAAFHDPRAATGTCIDCHRQKGGPAPVKCLECHKKP